MSLITNLLKTLVRYNDITISVDGLRPSCRQTHSKLLSSLFISTFLAVTPVAAKQFSLSQAEALKIARMTARDEGYILAGSDVWLEFEGKLSVGHPIPEYIKVSMYIGAHPLQSYAIRTDTGDVVDWMSCQLFRYPNLVKFQEDRLKQMSSHRPSVDQLASEVGCDFRILSVPKPLSKPIIQEPCDAC